MTSDELRLRLLRVDDIPATNRHSLTHTFGLQDTKQNVVAARRLRDGTLVFEFTLRTKEGKDPRRAVFTGRFR